MKRALTLLTLATIALSPLGAQESSPPLINISTRATIDTGNPRVIVGFTIPASPNPDKPWFPKTLVVRGIGPGLAQYGVTNPLPDPVVQLFDANGIELSESWVNDFTKPIDPANELDTAEARAAHGVAIAGIMAQVGAFSVPVPTLENPVVSDFSLAIGLPEGSYTLVVSSASGASGDILAEIYSVDP